MEILKFKVDRNLMEESLTQLANLNRIEIYHHDEDLFELLDFDDEKTFLEPALFIYQVLKETDKATTPLEQILWGYIQVQNRPARIPVRTCPEGWIALPMIGNFKTAILSSDLKMISPNGIDVHFEDMDGKEVEAKFHTEEKLGGSNIRIARHELEIYNNLHETELAETVTETYSKWVNCLQNAYQMMKKAVPDFCELLERTNREVSLFSSPGFNSFAAMSYFGTGFLNVEDQPYDEVFFIDDIAHQCGHVLYNTLTLKQDEYLAMDKDTELKGLTGLDIEHRSIYGAFHGLFTYSTIVYSLDQCIEQRLFDEKQLKDAIGRIGFYMRKFRFDLKQLNGANIFTEKGMAYYKMFLEGYYEVLNKYSGLPNPVYNGQPYTFRYQMFMEANPDFEGISYDFLNKTVKV